MGLFVLTCIDRPSALALRMSVREDHLAFVRAKGAMVKLGGPFLDGAGEMAGSMLIIEAHDMAAAEAFAGEDPYGRAGLFESVTIRPYRVTVGALT